MKCDTGVCKGMCCTFLCYIHDYKFDDDYKRFLRLHNIEIVEKVLWVRHKRIVRTYLKLPVQCSEFDPETFKCKIYNERPNWCRINPKEETPFINKTNCSILKR